MVHGCVAYGCTSNFRKGLGFFRFPIDPKRRLQWTIAVRRKNFIPNRHSRLCGKHFQTGRPSKDINHPDYVPNIFSFNQKNFDYETKNKTKKCVKELAEDLSELPFMNTFMQGFSQDDMPSETEDSDSNEQSKFDEELLPDFEAEIENTDVINVETVKSILANDAVRNPNAVPEKFSMYGKNRIPPTKFTFLDINGKVVAKFTEKRIRKNTPLEKKLSHPVFTSHKVKQTVPVIVDKKTAKTAYVDIDSIYGYKELKKLKKEINDDSYVELHLIDDSFHAIDIPEIKEEIEDDFEMDELENNSSFDLDMNEEEKNEEDLFAWYSELRSLENRKMTL